METSNILQVQTATDGMLWVTRGNAPCVSLGGTDPELLRQELAARSYLQVRILGMARNAAIIGSLFTYVADVPNCSVLIASPDVCYSEEERDSPEVSLHRMRQCVRSASLGGWHVGTLQDQQIYKLVAAVRDGASDDVLADAVQSHPAWYDLSFIPTVQPAAAAKFLAAVVDPRWHIDLRHPARLSRLKMRMGLTESHVVRAMAKPGGTATRVQTCRLLLDAWGARGDMPDNAAMLHPGNFVWRHVVAGKSLSRGVLRGGTVFLNYCAYTWQHQVVNTAGRQKIEFFLPEAMFSPEECQAYATHASRRG